MLALLAFVEVFFGHDFGVAEVVGVVEEEEEEYGGEDD